MRSAGLLIALAAAAAAEAPVARITVDPGRTHQTIDGFGVHLNATYFRESHKAMLDLLVKDLGATLFRLDPWGSSDWEWVNDDDDPSHPDQEYYRHRYSDGSFEAAWAAGRYLNSLGVKPILSFSGITPEWMNDTAPPPKHSVCRDAAEIKRAGEDRPHHLNPAMYAEFAETAVSLLAHARDRGQVAFEYFSPFNQTDCFPREGPRIDPEEMPRALEALARRLRREALGDLRLVVSEQAIAANNYIGPILDTPSLMRQVAVLALHSYGDNHADIAAQYERIRASKYPHTRIWLTEYGDGSVTDTTFENEWSKQSLAATRRALRAVNAGASAALFREAFDSFHEHHGRVLYYGLLRYDGDRFSPKKRYYAAKQLFGFVAAGAVRLEAASEASEVVVSAFRDRASDSIVLVGVKEGGADRIRIAVPRSAGKWELYATTRTLDCAKAGSEIAREGAVEFDLPGDAVFTVIGARPE